LGIYGITCCTSEKGKIKQPEPGTRSVAIIELNGLKFRDLNKNGDLDKYEDWRLTAEERSIELRSHINYVELEGSVPRSRAKGNRA